MSPAPRPRRRRPMAWSVATLEDLEGLGIDDRHSQAKALGVSLPQVDRVRRALRADHRSDTLRSPRRPRAPDGPELIQLGVRVPASIVSRLKRHAARQGTSMAVLTALALHDWLAQHNVPGSEPLGRKERTALGL